MPFQISNEVLIPVSLLVAFLVTRILASKRNGQHLPPGPRKLPLLGNLLDMPKPSNIDSEVYQKHAKEADSDIIHLSALGQSIVVLNSYKVAQDLLDKRSVLYSSRPHFTMFHELSGWGFVFSILPYGERWRSARRTFTKYFTPSNTSLNQPKDILYVRRLLNELLKKPDDFLAHTRTLVASTTLSMTYGIKIQFASDPFVTIAETAISSAASLLVPGAFFVDILPWMKHIPSWFPGAKFQHTAADMRNQANLMRTLPFKASEEMLKRGEYESAFVTDALRDIEHMSDGAEKSAEVETIKDIATQVFLAGADTTASALGTFFLAMVCHPEVQRKAQEELDRVVGKARLPEHSDFAKLPYLTAVVYETYRWKPVLPLGVPHQIIADDTYEGYIIPKGSIVMANQWAILRDEKDYPDPFTFRPERFLTKDGEIDKAVRNPMDVAFGFGRRICPGQYIAHSTLMLSAASILATFNLHKAKDAQGNVIEPSREYHEGFIIQPKNFPCEIRLRSKQAQELITAAIALE